MKKRFWIILLIISLIPIIIPIVYGIYSIFFGFTFFKTVYGLEALYTTIVIWSYVYWPSYIIGLILFIISLIKIKKSS